MEITEDLAKKETIDAAAIIGLVAMLAAFACWLLCVMVPVISWLMSGVIGAILLLCAALTRSNFRVKFLIVGGLSMIPPVVFIVVQSLPGFQTP